MTQDEIDRVQFLRERREQIIREANSELCEIARDLALITGRCDHLGPDAALSPGVCRICQQPVKPRGRPV